MGYVSESLYDAVGRVVKTIQNYVDGNPATGTADQDVTVDYVYTADGQQQMVVAENLNLQAAANSVAGGTVPFSSASGSGYLMYSAQDVQTRFAVSGSGSFIAVVWNDGQWEYDNGTGLTPFNPLPTDLLVATVNFGSGTAVSLHGTANIINGIESGYGGGTDGLSFSGTSGQVTVTGTSFVQNVLKQVTTYVYGSDLGSQPAGENFTPDICDNELLRAVIYPDSTNTVANVENGDSTGYDRVEYRYDRQGEEIGMTDQNGTVHDYIFDKLGERIEDQATTLGTGIDDDMTVDVRAIVTAYDALGRVQSVTSYNDPTGRTSSDVVNEVFNQYNEWGLLSREYQNPKGGIATDGGNVTDSTPYVGYDYVERGKRQLDRTEFLDRAGRRSLRAGQRYGLS